MRMLITVTWNCGWDVPSPKQFLMTLANVFFLFANPLLWKPTFLNSKTGAETTGTRKSSLRNLHNLQNTDMGTAATEIPLNYTPKMHLQTRFSRSSPELVDYFNEISEPASPNHSSGPRTPPFKHKSYHVIVTVDVQVHPVPQTLDELGDSSLTDSLGNISASSATLLGRVYQNKSESISRTIGNLNDPKFTTCKRDHHGFVWLADRSEDILIVKDDGRVVLPKTKKPKSAAGTGSMKSKSSGAKSSQPSIFRSKLEKLYDRVFMKKDKEFEWGTSSLDRRSIFKKKKKQLKTSKSENEVSLLPVKVEKKEITTKS